LILFFSDNISKGRFCCSSRLQIQIASVVKIVNVQLYIVYVRYSKMKCKVGFLSYLLIEMTSTLFTEREEILLIEM